VSRFADTIRRVVRLVYGLGLAVAALLLAFSDVDHYEGSAQALGVGAFSMILAAVLSKYSNDRLGFYFATLIGLSACGIVVAYTIWVALEVIQLDPRGALPAAAMPDRLASFLAVGLTIASVAVVLMPGYILGTNDSDSTRLHGEHDVQSADK